MKKETGLPDIDAILEKAMTAFRVFRNRSGKERADFLDAIAQEIELLGPELITTAMEETNLPEARLIGERGRTGNQLRQFAVMLREGSWVEARVDTALPDRAPLPKPDIRKMLVPIGPVVVFGASNFPFAYSTAGVDTASALAAGCPVVLKAHPAHPRTSNLVARAIATAIKKTGEHPHVFQHVDASSFEAGKALVQHPQTKAVGFTGSFSGGKALWDYAAQRQEPIPVFAEMGSINPVFILPGALKARGEKVAEMYAASITQGVGQFCTNPGLLLSIQSPELTSFASQLGEKIREVAPSTMLHPGIAKSFTANRANALKMKGVTLVAESVAPAKENQGIPTVATVAAVDFMNNPALVEEVFGPYSLLVQATSREELYAAVDAIPGQLTSTIIGEEDELESYADFIQHVIEKAGRVIINGIPTGVEVCPSMHHGGPFPSTTDSKFTSVGTDAVKRFVRPVSFQNFPQTLLPAELKDGNPLQIWRMVNSAWTR
ncbi:MAG: aldehyde dehydrogenase (NADP(+)) [Cytophagales bacterium]|nr:aldehyde dehydrogenase (NADP(+)) [Cytophagales bacterium]